MRLTSFWTHGNVLWRVFTWDDSVHGGGNGDRTFAAVGSAMSWPEALRQAAASQADETRNGQLVHRLTAVLNVGPNRPPGLHALRITNVDSFGVETVSSFNFN